MSAAPIRAWNHDTLTSELARAAAHPRRRVNLNLHGGDEAIVHRFLIAMQPDSYVRPHHHDQPHKLEMAVCLSGELEWIFFTPQGQVQRRVRLGGRAAEWAVEVPPHVFHAVIAHSPAVFLEIKQGPYDASTDKIWASWAPAEGTPESTGYLDWMKSGGY